MIASASPLTAPSNTPPSAPPHEWLIALLKRLAAPRAVDTLVATHPDDLWRDAVNTGLTTDAAILDELSARTRLRVATRLVSSDEARDTIPEALARRFHIVPLGVSAASLEIATADPYDLEGEQFLAFTTGRSIAMVLAAPTLIAHQLDALYSPHHALDQLLASLDAAPALTVAADGDEASPSSFEATDRPIIKLVDHILSAAIAARASDVHLEIEDRDVAVKHRIDGVLQHAMALPKAVGLPIVSRIKVMARMDIADRLRPQGGHAQVTLDGAPIDLRISTLPAARGEKVVVRILDPRNTLRPLDVLGFEPEAHARIRKLLDTREGLILMTGPTGSGKTTTLYAALQRLRQRGLNVVTVEDPVEYRVAGIVQVQVNDKAGLTFAAALRSILRQDPDVILIGEVRDQETATIAIQAALTGHLVFATLHTIDASSSITRLHDLGVAPGKVAAALKGVIAQRLLRHVCPHCVATTEQAIPSILWDQVAVGARLPAAVGCGRCGGTGYLGRIAAAEVVIVNQSIRPLIAKGASSTEIAQMVRQSGSPSLWTSGVSQLLQGATTLDELQRVFDAGDAASEAAEALPTHSLPPVRPPDPPKRAGSSPMDDDEPESRNDFQTGEYGARYDMDRSAPPSYPGTMTQIAAGFVDVYVIDPTHRPWRALILQRAPGGRSPGSWEAVHGKVDAGETPVDAAARELREETGLTLQRLYNVTVQPIYMHATDTVQLAIVFCAFVDSAEAVQLSEEHCAFEWLRMADAVERYTWPRATQAIHAVEKLLRDGTAGPAEDVMRVR